MLKIYEFNSNLEDAEASSDHDQKIGFVSKSSHSTGDYTEHGVHEESKSRDAQQYVIQIRLFF